MEIYGYIMHSFVYQMNKVLLIQWNFLYILYFDNIGMLYVRDFFVQVLENKYDVCIITVGLFIYDEGEEQAVANRSKHDFSLILVTLESN